MLLLPPSAPVVSAVPLDAAQARAAAAVARGESVVVTGAPGTGKSTLVVECAGQALQPPGRQPSSVLVLAATRRGASELRDLVAARAGRTVSAPPVRTADATAFAILRDLALSKGEPPPRLVSGPEQDRILSEILTAKLPELAQLLPPGLAPDVLLLRGFRNELRDLLMRASELGVSPRRLAELAEVRMGVSGEAQRALWLLAAQIYRDYLAVLALRTGGLDVGRQYDPAGLVAAAARALASWGDPATKPHYNLVIVDDYQEATAATAQLLSEFAADGAQLVLVGNPDQSVQGFRGAMPGLVGAASAPMGSRLGAFGLQQFVLDTAWRQTPELRQASAHIEAKVPTLGGTVARRKAVAALSEMLGGPVAAASVGSDAITVTVGQSPFQEAAWIARELRKEHLLNGTPWQQMAVITRSGSELSRLRRELVLAGVPVALLGSDVPLQDEPAVAPLLTLLRVSVATEPLAADVITGLLRSAIGGLDAIAIRRLRRALRVRELNAGGGRNSDDLLVEFAATALAGGSPWDGITVHLAPEDVAGVDRVLQVLAAGKAAVQQSEQDISTVLWALWAASGLGQVWRDTALAGGNAGMRADRDLDAVMALFRRAEFFVERNPGAGVERFVDDLTSQDIAADSVAAQAGTQDAVAAVTPAGAAGREWEVVVIAGVQDGTWPDLRIRDTMLGAGELVAIATEASPSDRQTSDSPDARFLAARAEVLADETRSFLVATSRARRRLLVTAVADADYAPSQFLALLEVEPQILELDEVSPLDLRGVVMAARTALVQGGGAAEAAAAELLANLWAAGVTGADPASWYGVQALSSDSPLWESDARVRVSPSKVESIAKCPLKWAFEAAGATAGDALSQSVGTLIHNIAGDFPSATLDELRAQLDQRWPELGMSPGWQETQERVKADAMLQRLATYYQKQNDIFGVHTEIDFRLEVGRTLVSGRADRIEDIGNNEYRVIDFKTGSTIPSNDEIPTNAQLATYQLALNSAAFGDLPAGAKCVSAQLLFLSKGATGPTLRSQSGLTADGEMQAKAVLQETGEIMAAAKFAAKSNPLCRSCGLKFACPLQAAGKQVIA